jgi:potassium-transporting ATPase ATP-binding subunit
LSAERAVVFSKLVQALSRGRGRAGAPVLRPVGRATEATLRDGSTKPAAELVGGDVVVVDVGETLPSDGRVIEGSALVDESAITGESAPALRESGSDRGAVMAGTTVLSGRIVVEVRRAP